MQPRPDAALKARAAAAHEVLRESPGVDGLELLALVVWPTPALEQVPERTPGEALDARVFELAVAGLRSYAIACELGRPRSTVAEVLRRGHHGLAA